MPHPVLLVLGGLGLAFVPGLPRVALPPEDLFTLFIPPLLFNCAVRASLRDFWHDLGAMVRLAVLLVLVTLAAVALAARRLDPALTWAAACVLGAIVAPPDPVAVAAVLRAFPVPSILADVLQGEGLLNHATTLVAYHAALAAAMTGSFSLVNAGADLLGGGAAGVAVGMVVGWLVARLRASIARSPTLEGTVTLLAPYAAYLVGRALGISGVLAVVAAGLYVARGAHRLPPATRLRVIALWDVVIFMLESLIFIIVGLELPTVARALRGYSIWTLIGEGAAVSALVIVVRLAFVWPSALLARAAGSRVLRAWSPSEFRRSLVFVGWAGMRGSTSLVLALSLPYATRGSPFPARPQITFVTFFVILTTLLLQGTTLGPLARRLRLRRDARTGDEAAHARRVAAEAGRTRLQAIAGGISSPGLERRLRVDAARQVRRWAGIERGRRGPAHRHPGEDPDLAGGRAQARLELTREAEFRRARRDMLDAERAAVVELRDRGEIGDDALREVLRELDLELLLLDSRDAEASLDAEGAGGAEGDDAAPRPA